MKDDADELRYAEAMIRLLQLDVVGPLTKSRESPDFVVMLSPSRSVGLEVARAIDARLAAGAGAIWKLKMGIRSGLTKHGIIHRCVGLQPERRCGCAAGGA